VSLLKRYSGEAAFAVYRRRLDCQSMGQLHDVSVIGLPEFERARDQVGLIANTGQLVF
jgi:hypothetical protein